MKEAPRKFVTLDALRGIASILVVIRHFPTIFGHHNPIHFYLAVDLFFALSGFVLSYAYQQRLDDGLPTLTFLGARVVRLWPLYLVGLVLGILIPFYPGQYGTGYEVWTALLMIPAWNRNREAPLYPLNAPTWTLGLELMANVVHALFLRRLTTKALVGALAVIAVFLSVGVYSFGYLDTGWSDESFLSVGLPRVLFSYILGMLLFRAWQRRIFAVRVPAILPCVGLLLLLCTPNVGSHEFLFLFLAFVFAIPAILLFGAYSEPSGPMRRTFTILGVASYAIYVLHEPVGVALKRYWPRALGTAVSSAPWSGLLFLAVLISLAVWLDRVYDLPLRRRLRRVLHV